MFYIEKTIEISACHQIFLDYASKCENLHGHNWAITVYCKSKMLNKNGMVTDFTEIKKTLQEKMDHKNLNEVFNFNPTSENIAKWIVDNIDNCYKAVVMENSNNKATYSKAI